MYYTSREVYEYISKHNNDPIIERKTCTVSGQPFGIFQSDLDFYAKISPTFAGQKFQIPTPTLCPEERQRNITYRRNERKLYKRKCDATGDTIISIYSPEKTQKVYRQDFWRSDGWSPLSYGKEFDFSKTFREQFSDLIKIVPLINLIIGGSENADYTNFARENKSSYLLCASDYNENCLFGENVFRSTSVVDMTFVNNTQQSYECVDSERIYKCYYVQNCKDTNNCYYCYNCSNCSYCIGCTNLHNKTYHYHNKPVSKEIFEQKLLEIQSNPKNIIQHFQKIKESGVNLYSDVINSESSYGNYIFGSKKCINCYDIINSESCKNTCIGLGAKDCYDSIGVPSSSLIYQSTGIPENNNIINCVCIWPPSHNLLYCYSCVQSNHCFGCVSSKNNEYCIFNKQYTKSEYEITVAKIITHMQETGEWGEFFHPSLSPFGYNETVANEYFPLSKQEAIAKGYKRQDNNYDPTIPEGAKVIDWKTRDQNDGKLLPSQEWEGIGSEGEILKAIFVCEVSDRPYRIIKQELEFYRKHNLPLPRRHPDIRHEQRMSLRPKRQLSLRQCDCCKKEILSVYDKNYNGKIYCESCYTKEIYS